MFHIQWSVYMKKNHENLIKHNVSNNTQIFQYTDQCIWKSMKPLIKHNVSYTLISVFEKSMKTLIKHNVFKYTDQCIWKKHENPYKTQCFQIHWKTVKMQCTKIPRMPWYELESWTTRIPREYSQNVLVANVLPRIPSSPGWRLHSGRFLELFAPVFRIHFVLV